LFINSLRITWVFLAQKEGKDTMTQTFAFRQVQVFDGVRMIPHDTVLVQDGRITATGSDLVLSDETHIIHGTGQTLLPGLIDAHAHVLGSALRQALLFGVTTELDMANDVRLIQALKRQLETEQGLEMADLRSAGCSATVPGGHGTEYGGKPPTLTSPDEAQVFVDARISEGSDYIKIMYDDGRTVGRKIPTLSKETMAAVVEAAHLRGKLALAHILALQDARDALEAGADGLAHLFVDRVPDPEFGAFVAAHHAFVIPTLTILELLCKEPAALSLLSDTRLAPYLSQDDISFIQRFQQFDPSAASPDSSSVLSYTAAVESVRQLKAAGVPILAGTDSLYALHGVSMHREMELLVLAGLSTVEALAAATSVPATIFGLSDRGRITPGMRADLFLVQGDPTNDITATRNIVGVWKLGIPTHRQPRSLSFK